VEGSKLDGGVLFADRLVTHSHSCRLSAEGVCDLDLPRRTDPV
jgi:hypothetical protein